VEEISELPRERHALQAFSSFDRQPLPAMLGA
jgi:hypothetical protein